MTVTFILDFETTGLNIFHDDIIEYAILETKSKSFQSEVIKLQKKRKVSDFITKLTSITTEMTENGVDMEKAIENLVGFINNHSKKGENIVMISHNGDAFDFPILRRLLKENNMVLERKVKYLDTLRFAQVLLPRLFRYNQANLCKVFKIVNESEHRALGDIQALEKIYTALSKMHSKSKIDTLKQIDFIYNKI